MDVKKAATSIWGHVVAALVALLVAPIVAVATGGIPKAVANYDILLLVTALSMLAIAFALDLFIDLKRDHRTYTTLILYGGVFTLFAILSVLSSSEQKQQGLPVAVSAVTLLLFRILAFRIKERPMEQTGLAVSGVGFASAGTLVVSEIGKKPYFVLVNNTNLRGGEGLWVPPGGHIQPEKQRPHEQLIRKIEEETGFACSLLNPLSELMPSDPVRQESAACVWLAPPTFLLREDLMGTCSQGHHTHIDFAYICLSNGSIVNTTPKYNSERRIEVDVASCAKSYSSAHEAIELRIEQFDRAKRGTARGMLDSLTQDVVWRLHLTAKYLLDQGKVVE